jgi:hypothetical protein
MCQALSGRGLVWDLNDPIHYTNNLIHQRTDITISTAMETLARGEHVAIKEDGVMSGHATSFTRRLPNTTIYSLHRNLIWHTGVSAIENLATFPEDKIAYLD